MTSVATPPTLGDADTRAAALEAQQYLSSRLAATSAAPSFRTIPIVDLKPSFSESLSSRQAVAKQIHEACTKVGFFYITGHGMEDVCDQTLKLAERFHNELPQPAKDAIHMSKSKYFRGYENASYSYVNSFTKKETKEAFNWGYEDGLDSQGGDGKYVELDGSPPDSDANQWPRDSQLPGFYDGIKEYYGEVSSHYQKSEPF